MLPATILFNTSKPGSTAHSVGYALLIFFIADLFILVLNGASPVSPTGALSTYFLWKVRGNATFSVPYKVVWAAYIFSLLPLLIRSDYHGLNIALIASITNSIILVVFRF